MSSERKNPKPLTPGPSKGGQNLPEMMTERPPAPQGSGGSQCNSPSRKPKWHAVQVVAAEGTVLGVSSSESGTLEIVICNPDGTWPHGKSPMPESIAEIAPGNTAYEVFVKS